MPFPPGDEFPALFVTDLADAPASASPLDAVATSLDTVAAGFPAPREYARQRRLVIGANPQLQEHELVKMVSVFAAIAGALVTSQLIARVGTRPVHAVSAVISV